MSQFEFRVIRLPLWALVLVLSLALALGLALAVVAAGLFLIIFPAVLIVAAVAGLLGAFRARQRTRHRMHVIDADFVEVDQHSLHKDHRSLDTPPGHTR